MKKIKKYCNGGIIIISVILVAAVLGFAAPCKHMIETAKGTSVHMSCFYLYIPAFMSACIGVSLGIMGLKEKKVLTLPVIVTGILIVISTIPAIGGIKICANADMPCHVTILWMRVLGVIMAILGVLSLYNSEKQI